MNKKIRKHLFNYRITRNKIKILHEILGSIGLCFFLWMPCVFNQFNIEISKNNINLFLILISIIFGGLLLVLNIKNMHSSKVRVLSELKPDFILGNKFVKNNSTYTYSFDQTKCGLKFVAISNQNKIILYDQSPLLRMCYV